VKRCFFVPGPNNRNPVERRNWILIGGGPPDTNLGHGEAKRGKNRPCINPKGVCPGPTRKKKGKSWEFLNFPFLAANRYKGRKVSKSLAYEGEERLEKPKADFGSPSDNNGEAICAFSRSPQEREMFAPEKGMGRRALAPRPADQTQKNGNN